VKLTAVMVVRDEAEIVPATIAYHRQFADEVLILDNGSIDRTTDVLAAMAATDPAVRWTSQPGPFSQDVMLSDLALEAHAGGADWVLPIDADEFWWCAGDLREVLAESTAGGLACRVENFAQDRRVLDRAVDNLTTMRWRAVVRATEGDSPDRVQAGDISFLEMRYPPKFVCRPTADVIIHMGSHHVELVDGELDETDELAVLHAPIRCRAILAQRAEAGQRRALEQPDVRIGWHLRRVADLEAAGRLDEEWRSCSALDGALEVSGRRHPVVPDDRLVQAAAPFVGARPSRWAFRRPRRRHS
jgi:Glycosyl transferase family 2